MFVRKVTAGSWGRGRPFGGHWFRQGDIGEQDFGLWVDKELFFNVDRDHSRGVNGSVEAEAVDGDSDGRPVLAHGQDRVGQVVELTHDAEGPSPTG